MKDDRKLWKAMTMPGVKCPWMTSITPMPSTARLATAVMALSDSVESSSRAGEPPLTLERQMIHPVMLVPITAPMMIAIAWRSFIIAEFTKPTTMTLVAEEDWITAVTPVPSRIPLTGVPDRRYRISSSRLPATFFSPSPIRAMP